LVHSPVLPHTWLNFVQSWHVLLCRPHRVSAPPSLQAPFKSMQPPHVKTMPLLLVLAVPLLLALLPTAPLLLAPPLPEPAPPLLRIIAPPEEEPVKPSPGVAPSFGSVPKLELFEPPPQE
jgi:hypothetical protein